MMEGGRQCVARWYGQEDRELLAMEDTEVGGGRKGNVVWKKGYKGEEDLV
jgi:hypothetical protein